MKLIDYTNSIMDLLLERECESALFFKAPSFSSTFELLEEDYYLDSEKELDYYES